MIPEAHDHNYPLSKLLANIDASGEVSLSTWAKRVAYLHPRNIVELGTGQGAGANQMMHGLDAGASLVTINYQWPVDYYFGAMLDRWANDDRLMRLIGSTIDPATVDLIPDGVDLLYIDSHHEAWHAALELELWQRKLCDGALVILDDLDHNDMMSFYSDLMYSKQLIQGSTQGIFRYDRRMTYTSPFPRGRTPKEIAGC